MLKVTSRTVSGATVLFFGLFVVMSGALTTTARAQSSWSTILPMPSIELATLPTSLEDTMKGMAGALRAIVVSDASKNAANAQAADQFVALAVHAKDFTPDTIVIMPATQQAAAKADYARMMDETADLGRTLAQAFRDDDNVKAQSLLQQLNTEKREGHSRFK